MGEKKRSAIEYDYDDQIGWARVDDLVSTARARSILQACEQRLDTIDTDLRVGDKPHAGTRRLVDVTERVPETAEVVSGLEPVIASILGGPFRMSEGTFRCPHPGFGQQKLHADAVPKLAPGPNLCATAIVPLVDFTEANGATRVVPGSAHRPDLQRQSGNLDRADGEHRLVGPVGVGFVFSGHLLHSGTKNESDQPRPCLQFVFVADQP